MSPCFFDAVGELVGFPRVSGDEPVLSHHVPLSHEFSPRERG